MARPAEQNTGATAASAVADQTAISSLRRGLSLLEHFTPAVRELGIRELARRSGIPTSTTHRLVGELLAWGALSRGRSGVRLGTRLFELGLLVSTPTRLREIAVPYAHDLTAITGLTCNLAVREGRDVLYIEKIGTRTLQVPHSRLGGRLAVHATALGKAMLAHGNLTFVNEVLADPLQPLTPKTITDPEILRHQLADIRRDGVAYDVEESRLGLFCVAAPLLANSGAAVGALSVTGATEMHQARAFSAAVRATAMAISRAVRSTGSSPVHP